MIEKDIIKDVKIVDIKDINSSECFYHYTNIKNLDSIKKNGLIPKIGINSKVIEKSKKIFFSYGEEGTLVIMDSWIKWLIAKPKCNLIYWIGAYLLKIKYFPKFIHKAIVLTNQRNKRKAEWSYKELKNILENSVYLILDLKENIDFSFDDIDEVKAYSHYPASYIESLYAYNSDVNDSKVEYWNMHTFSNKIIEPNKITLLKYKNSYNADLIIKYLIEKNMIFVKKNCEYLYKYYNYFYEKDIC